MRDLTNLLSTFISHFFLGGQQRATFSRLATNIAASFFLIGGYGLGCKVLYHYLALDWGEAFSLLALCVIFFITSFVLYGVGYFLKPKKPSPSEIIPKLGETLHQLPNYDLIKKVFSVVSPKMLIGLITTAVVAAYVVNTEKKNS